MGTGKKSYTLSELAGLTHAQLVGDPAHVITGFADLESAQKHDVSFLSNPAYLSTRYESAMQQSHAGAIFVAPGVTLPERRNFLVAEDPSRAFQTAIEAMRGPQRRSGFHGIHPTAVIHDAACVEEGVSVGPHAVIDAGVKLGKGTCIGAGSYIGPDTIIGEQCVLHPHVTIRESCIIGNRVVVHAGAVIGSCGFGYTTDKKGRHTRLQHIGKVILEDDVEIGANTTVDRARFIVTKVGRGSKIDNLVDIGHNVKVGEHNLICAQSGVAGSTETGRNVVLGGQVGVNGHIKLSDGVMVTAKSGVTKSLQAGKYGGIPVQPLDQYNRTSVMIRNIAEFANTVKELQKRVEQLEKISGSSCE